MHPILHDSTYTYFTFLEEPSKLPKCKDEKQDNLFKELLSKPVILVVLLANFVSAYTWIFLDPVLEPHMRVVCRIIILVNIILYCNILYVLTLRLTIKIHN